MVNTKYKRRTKEEKILDLEQQLQKLRNEVVTSKTKKPSLNKNSPGMPELADQLVRVANENNVILIDVLEQLAKMKRLGVTITKK